MIGVPDNRAGDADLPRAGLQGVLASVWAAVRGHNTMWNDGPGTLRWDGVSWRYLVAQISLKGFGVKALEASADQIKRR